LVCFLWGWFWCGVFGFWVFFGVFVVVGVWRFGVVQEPTAANQTRLQVWLL